MKTLTKLVASFTLILFTGACLAAETKTVATQKLQSISLQEFIAEVEAIDSSALEMYKIEQEVQKNELDKFIKAVQEIDPSALSLDENEILLTKGKSITPMSLVEFTASVSAVDPSALEIPADEGMYVSKVNYNKEKELECCKIMLVNGFLVEIRNELEKAFRAVDFQELDHKIKKKVRVELGRALHEIENEIE